VSLIIGSSAEDRSRIHVCRIGGVWLATWRGEGIEDRAANTGATVTWPLPYAPSVEAETVAALLQRQNPAAIIVIDRPVLA